MAQTISPDQIIEVHEVDDSDKVAALAESMEANGWQGRPIIAHDDDNGIWAWTGAHRVAAARIAGIEVPVHCLSMDALNTFCAEHDMTPDELSDDYDREWAIEEMADEVALAIIREEI